MSENVYYENNCLVDSMTDHIGKTVTVYTNSGGVSGCGFTGVLAAVTPNCIKLITQIGAAPSCPIGSNCSGCNLGRGTFNRNNFRCSDNWLGSVTDIPICSIVGFTHHAI